MDLEKIQEKLDKGEELSSKEVKALHKDAEEVDEDAVQQWLAERKK